MSEWSTETRPCMTDGRWRLVRIATPLLSAVVRGKMDAATSTTAPDDLTIIGMHEASYGPDHSYVFVVWSASFAPLKLAADGRLAEDIPYVDFTYTR